VRPNPLRRTGGILLALAIVAAAWTALQLYGLALTPFHTRGEPREAIVVQDLVRHGNWILPRRNGVQLPRKPPLFYWLATGAARVRGAVDEASVRLPSALQSGAACLIVAAVAAALYGGVAGTAAGITLLTSFEWLRAATAARVDMTTTFGLVLVFVGLLMYRRAERGIWLFLVYGGAAWATLSKGIPGLAIPALAVLLLCLFVDRSLAFAWRLRPIVGVLAVLIVCGAWYVAAAMQGGHDFVSIAINENFVRAVGARQFSLGHQHSVLYLVGVLAAGLLPWIVLLPFVAVALWRERRKMDRWDPRLFALVWSVAVFAPYAFASCKRGVYLLPLYPAVTLLLGWWAAQLVRGLAGSRALAVLLAVLGWTLGVVAGLLALIAAAESAGVPMLDSAAALLDPRTARTFDASPQTSVGTVPSRICLAVASAAAVVLACCAVRRAGVRPGRYGGVHRRRRVRRAHGDPAAVGAGDTRRESAQALRRVVGDPADLHTMGGLDYGTIFY
jgi:4-amino-4-deoxy-L-arabinose transferase-like glycosyltransferase